MRLWHGVEKWGPCAAAVIAIIAVIGVGWTSSERISRLEGEVLAHSGMEIALRAEIQTWQAYVISLQKLMVEHGIKNIPEAPKPTKQER